LSAGATPGVGNGGTRLPFPGNLIPISRISPAAGKILALFPDPASSSILNNFIGSGSGPFSQNGFDTRIDYAASQKSEYFWTVQPQLFQFIRARTSRHIAGPGNGLLGLSGSSITHNYSLATGFTKTLSPTLLTDFRFGYFKYNPQTKKPDGGTPMTDFGIPGANTSDPKTAGLGSFQLGGDPISGFAGSPANSGQGFSYIEFWRWSRCRALQLPTYRK
jgi:hypothetical protein